MYKKGHPWVIHGVHGLSNMWAGMSISVVTVNMTEVLSRYISQIVNCSYDARFPTMFGNNFCGFSQDS